MTTQFKDHYSIFLVKPRDESDKRWAIFEQQPNGDMIMLHDPDEFPMDKYSQDDMELIIQGMLKRAGAINIKRVTQDN